MNQTPTHKLVEIQQQVKIRGTSCFTSKSIETAQDELGLTTEEMIAMILSRNDTLCYKTMPSTTHQGQMQDVYHWPTPNGQMAYVKFSLGPKGQVVVSFKEK